MDCLSADVDDCDADWGELEQVHSIFTEGPFDRGQEKGLAGASRCGDEEKTMDFR